MSASLLWSVASDVLLFFIFFGLSGDVDVHGFRQKFVNPQQRRSLLAGMFGQFIVLPLLGFLAVRLFDMTKAEGITLLVVASSPGGAFSNWWCALYNADLALSIAMTTTSTLLALLILPLNTFLYITLAFGINVPLNFISLGLTCLIVLLGTGLGLTVSWMAPQCKNVMHVLGNLAALSSMLISIFLSSGGPQPAPIWHRDARFYCPIAIMCTAAVFVGLLISTALRLSKPERVALAVEVMYQNVAVAASAVVTMFHDPQEIAAAAGVPLFYGVVSAVVLFLFCNVMWKCGWTFASASDPLCRVLFSNYQPRTVDGARDGDVPAGPPTVADADSIPTEEPPHYTPLIEDEPTQIAPQLGASDAFFPLTHSNGT